MPLNTTKNRAPHVDPPKADKVCFHTAVITAALCLALATPTTAQTGVGLVVRSWSENQQSQLNTQALLLNKTETDNADARFRLQRYDLSGRWRSDPQQPDFMAGFDTTYINITTDDPALPERLVDQSIAAAWLLTEQDQVNTLWLVVGAGYAGDLPYAESHSLYAQANIIYTMPVSKEAAWQFVLNYDGNRVILPDVPLPAIAYQARASDTLSYSLGLPVSSLTWHPQENLTIRLTYAVPVSINAVVEYDLTPGWTTFAAFNGQTEAYTRKNDRDHRRLFFQQRRLEAGIRFTADQQAQITIAAGYAFSQEFNTGFDLRDTEDLAEIDDEPYIRVAVKVPF